MNWLLKDWRASARSVSPSKSRYYATFARRVACALPSGRGAAIDAFRADLEACAPLRLRGPFDQNSLAARICNGGCLEPWLFAHLWRPGPGRARVAQAPRRRRPRRRAAGPLPSPPCGGAVP